MSAPILIVHVAAEPLALLRRTLRDVFASADRRLVMSHAAEAVASGLGFRSHAALLASLGGTAGSRLDQDFHPEAVVASLRTLAEIPQEDAWTSVRKWVSSHLLSGIMVSPAMLSADRLVVDDRLPPIDLTFRGGMISASKSGYLSAHPGHQVVFNAVLFTAPDGKIWWGDLDLTRDVQDLERISLEVGDAIYVLREFDGATVGDRPSKEDLLGRCVTVVGEAGPAGAQPARATA